MADRVTVAVEWSGSGTMPSQMATAVQVTTPGRYFVDIPRRERRSGGGRHEVQSPERLIVEIEPPDPDLVAIVQRLVREQMRIAGHCVLCNEGERVGHADGCLAAEARRALALIESEPQRESRR